MIDILIAFSLGVFIMILHRRADKVTHHKIDELHEYITKEHREVISKIQEMLESEKKVDEEIHNMVEEQKKLVADLHSMSIAEQNLDQSVHTMVSEQQKLIKELHERYKNNKL